MVANENGDSSAAAKLVRLRTEHRDLDTAIEALMNTLAADQRPPVALSRHGD